MKTEAWVLKEKDEASAEFVYEEFEFSDIQSDEVLAEPLIGSVEGNYVHAVEKKPENIFAARGEDRIVLGNAGIVRIKETGSDVKNVAPGDICILFGNAKPDKYGYPIKVTGYDQPGSVGMLAKTIKLTSHEVIPIPKDTKLTYEQWAMFSLKFVTAWSNWKSALKAFRIQMEDMPLEEMNVWGWGGGVSYAELRLASLLGCRTGMILGSSDMQELCRKNGIAAVDRNMPQSSIIEEVMKLTGGEGVSVFIDNIGKATYNTTMRLLSRQGVLATCGWRSGGMYPVIRQNECINRHIHVFTHYAPMRDGIEAIDFAEKHDWIPPYDGEVCSFEKVPQLIEDVRLGRNRSYYSLFRINEI